MKRHICYYCKKKRNINLMKSVIITGKNGVAYSSWVCSDINFMFKNIPTDCEKKYMDANQDNVHIPGAKNEN